MSEITCCFYFCFYPLAISWVHVWDSGAKKELHQQLNDEQSKLDRSWIKEQRQELSSMPIHPQTVRNANHKIPDNEARGWVTSCCIFWVRGIVSEVCCTGSFLLFWPSCFSLNSYVFHACKHSMYTQLWLGGCTLYTYLKRASDVLSLSIL